MKLPRDVSGAELSRALRALGYETTRQTGSHVRLTTQRDGEHHVTIPAHDPIKVGTLAAIVRDVCEHHRIPKEDVIRMLR